MFHDSYLKAFGCAAAGLVELSACSSIVHYTAVQVQVLGPPDRADAAAV